MEIRFSVFEKNIRPHVTYSNRFRPKTMFKATSTSFIFYLARKKERNTGSRTITCFNRKLDSWKFIWAIRKFLIRNKKKVKTNCDLLMSYEVSEIHLVKKRKWLKIAGLKTITTVPSSTLNRFRNLALHAVFAFTKSRSILYNEILFYVVNTFFFFFALGRYASMRINKLVSKENWTKTKDCNGHQCARVEDAYFFLRFDVASTACL